MNDITLAQLGTIRIASPCPMQWDELEGEGNIRHCGACQLDVHNFSEMTPGEVAAVLAMKKEGGRLCAGWYRRTDGTMIMKDCPVGVRLVRQKLRRTASRIAAAVGMLITGSVALAMPGRTAARVRTYQPFAALCEWLSPTAPPPVQRMIMGDIAIPPAMFVSPAPPPAPTAFEEAVTPIGHE